MSEYLAMLCRNSPLRKRIVMILHWKLTGYHPSHCKRWNNLTPMPIRPIETMNEQQRINFDYAKALHEKSKRTFEEVGHARSGQEVVDIFNKIIETRKLQTRVIFERKV